MSKTRQEEVDRLLGILEEKGLDGIAFQLRQHIAALETLPEDVALDVAAIEPPLMDGVSWSSTADKEHVRACLSRLASAAARVPGLVAEVQQAHAEEAGANARLLELEQQRDHSVNMLRSALAALKDAAQNGTISEHDYGEVAHFLEDEMLDDDGRRIATRAESECDALKDQLSRVTESRDAANRLAEGMAARIAVLETELRASEEASGMYAERSGRFAEQADRLESERDAARQEAAHLRAEVDFTSEALEGLTAGTMLRDVAEQRMLELRTAREQLRDLAQENEVLSTRNAALLSARDAAMYLVDAMHLHGGRDLMHAWSEACLLLGRNDWGSTEPKVVASLRERVAEAERSLASEEKECLDAMKDRDDALEVIEEAASALGCEEEWSNSHDHRQCLPGYVERLTARVAELERRSWIQCTTVSNECLGGCRSMQEHDRCRQQELRTKCENLSPLVVLHEDMVRLKRESEARATAAEAAASEEQAINEEAWDVLEEAGIDRTCTLAEGIRKLQVVHTAAEAKAQALEERVRELHGDFIVSGPDTHPAPAPGLREAMGPRITATERLVDVARRLSGGANNRIAWDDLDAALAAYDAAKGGEGPSLNAKRTATPHDVLCAAHISALAPCGHKPGCQQDAHRAAVGQNLREEGSLADLLTLLARPETDTLLRVETEGEQLYLVDGSELNEIAEKARKWDAAEWRLEHERKAGAKREVWEYAHVILHGDTPPSGPGGGDERDHESWCACAKCKNGKYHPDEAPTPPAPLTPGSLAAVVEEVADEAEARAQQEMDRRDGSGSPESAALQGRADGAREVLRRALLDTYDATPPAVTHAQLAAVAQETLDAFDATTRPCRPGSVVPLLRERDEALERLRRTLSGNAPRVLREERVVEVLLELLDFCCGLQNQPNECGNCHHIHKAASDLNLTLPGGEPASKPQPDGNPYLKKDGTRRAELVKAWEAVGPLPSSCLASDEPAPLDTPMPEEMEPGEACDCGEPPYTHERRNGCNAGLPAVLEYGMMRARTASRPCPGCDSTDGHGLGCQFGHMPSPPPGESQPAPAEPEVVWEDDTAQVLVSSEEVVIVSLDDSGRDSGEMWLRSVLEDVARALAEAKREVARAERSAICSVLDRLGADGANSFRSEDDADALGAEVWKHVQWLEEMAARRAAEDMRVRCAQALLARRDQMQGRAMEDGRRRGLEEGASIVRSLPLEAK